MAVDDRLSTLKKYRVAIAGRTSARTLLIQVRMLDLVHNVFDEFSANLSSLDQTCVSDIMLKE